MYCKLFASLYQGTLRGCSNEILVFTNLLANADQYGIVDKHFRAIAEEVGLTVEQVKSAIEVLEAPDLESRSPEANGSRLVKMDEHRVWGWKIINYGKYRAIRNEDDRREQNRLAQARWRENSKQTVSKVSKVSHGKPPSAHTEAEAEAEERKKEGFASLPIARNGQGMVKPTKDQLELQATKIGLPLTEIEKFINYYTANGWRVGKNPMRSWVHALSNWKLNLAAFAPRGSQTEKPKAKFLL